ncbi:transcriptional regulator [Pullulanibacillus camelliae]|uniref:Transcriptional regulator n=1 Tax=Pullulanibacillus camelliae TaxID=1707096 RepID=A0A8J2YN18_9BACL|nr:MerR family transcriptional regulator [Pullulanibacillus camelliae]GGE56305.1 transcriptional regulator [Pullulanibacillus camelliae]
MYKIGDISKLAHVSKRTVDYYTQLGLLEAERSASNHRYYTEDAINDIHMIMKYKAQHFTLDEIKEKLALKKTLNNDTVYKSLENLSEHMKLLDEDFVQLQALIDCLDTRHLRYLNKKINTEGKALLQSWTLFLKEMT